MLSKSSGLTLQFFMPFTWVLKLFLLYINISFWPYIQPCWQTRFGSVFLFWRLFTAATSACSLQVLGRWILKWAHHSKCVGAMNKLSISVWFWLWRTDLNLTKDGNPTLTHRTGRKTWFFSGIGALCHLFQHGCEIPEQKSKAALRLRMWLCAAFNKQPWFYWQRAGSALCKSSSCWGVRGQTGNIESFQRRKVLEKSENTLRRRHPFALRWRSFTWWSFAQPRIVLFEGKWRMLFYLAGNM